MHPLICPLGRPMRLRLLAAFVTVLPLCRAGGDATDSDSPFRWGSAVFHPAIAYSDSYGTGIENAPGHSTDSFIQTLAPSLAADLSPRLSVVYAPTWTYYSSGALHNSLGQFGSITAAGNADDWEIKGDQTVTIKSAPLVQTGEQTRERTAVTQLNASRQLSEQFELALGLLQTLGSASVQYSQLREWGSSDSLRYRIDSRWTASLQITSTYIDILGGTQLIETSPQLALGWKATESTQFSVYAGIINQSFLRKGAADATSASGGLALSRAWNQVTTVQLAASQAATFSYLTEQNVKTSSLGSALRQRLLQHYFFNAGAQLAHVIYGASPLTGYPSRGDRTLDWNVGLSTEGILRHGRLAVTYARTRNLSSAAAFSQAPRIIGLQAALSY